jgi:DNA modification methylase
MNDSAYEGFFDHVITDIPYGIDMDMLNQQNPHGGMKDIDTIEAEHDVEDNKRLFADFFPAAYKCTKPDAFVITWCDIMNWQLMYDLATKAGFKVQRWPITWCKTHSCMNQSAQFNFTKSTEIAIVCRKGRATLVQPKPRCDVNAGRDDLCDAIGHPFAKPFEVWRFLTEAVSFEGQRILEPFAGRGSGVISMMQMKRNVTGVELNEAHYNALLENVKTLHFLKLNPNCQFK